MIDWAKLTLFLFIVARMSGFVFFNPLLGRKGIPGFFRAGLILSLAIAAFQLSVQTVTMPRSILEFIVKLTLELSVGYLLGLIMNLFFYIPILAGEVIDTQMGMTMSKIYDAGSQASMSVTSTLLNLLMMLLFFAGNGHLTLMRILMTSGELMPFGTAALGEAAANTVVELFLQCTLLAVKLCMPILAAELMGQVGMGILMKAIPQINVFAINIELKVIIGLILIFLLLAPFSEFLLDAESTMLAELHRALALTG